MDNVYIKHSGNIGDVIYSLASVLSIKTCASTQDINIHLRLELNVPMELYKGAQHPNGNVKITQKVYDMFTSLKNALPYIASIGVYDTSETLLPNAKLIDLDLFRKIPINYMGGNLAQWYQDLIGLPIALDKPWMEKTGAIEHAIVVARSSRYHNACYDYEGLKNVKFTVVGHPSEFGVFSNHKYAEFKTVSNFDEMRRIIAGSKLFIGNQSFPFALAEAMKVRRILEPCLFADNVQPQGGIWYKPYTKAFFDHLVATSARAYGVLVE